MTEYPLLQVLFFIAALFGPQSAVDITITGPNINAHWTRAEEGWAAENKIWSVKELSVEVREGDKPPLVNDVSDFVKAAIGHDWSKERKVTLSPMVTLEKTNDGFVFRQNDGDPTEKAYRIVYGKNFPQTRKLADGTAIRMESAWIYVTNPTLLRARFTYLQVDPNDHYRLRATLRDAWKAKEVDSAFVWQVGVVDPKLPAGDMPKVWEFRDFPKDSERIYLRLCFEDTKTGEEKERLEFILPSFKKLVKKKDGDSDVPSR